jgi:hypothetical protein
MAIFVEAPQASLGPMVSLLLFYCCVQLIQKPNDGNVKVIYSMNDESSFEPGLMQ